MATLEEELFFSRMNNPELAQNTMPLNFASQGQQPASNIPTMSANDVMSAVANSGVDMNNPRAREIMKNIEQSGENPENLRRQFDSFKNIADTALLESFKNKSFMNLEDGQIVQRGTPVGLGTSPERSFVENEIANNDAILNRAAQKNYTENERDFGFNVGSLMDNQMANANQTTMQALFSLLESGKISPQEAEQALNRINQKEREASQNAFNQAAQIRRSLNLTNRDPSIPKHSPINVYIPPTDDGLKQKEQEEFKKAEARRGLNLSNEGLSIPRRGN